jgi:hypothetical protein
VPADAALDPGLPVAAVARRLGVAPSTLRTWDRRYGLGPSVHRPGSHRRYGPSDIQRLELMRRLALQGVAPADAARHALAMPDSILPAAAPAGPGGAGLTLPGADAAGRGRGRAALALDAEAVTAAVLAEIRGRGVVDAWNDLLRPVLFAVGARWAVTGEGVEVEHLLADCIMSVLRQVVTERTLTPPPRPVILASAPDEQHCLPVYALAAALAEREVPVRVLGAATPGPALAAAVRRTGPSALFVWSQLAVTGALETLHSLPALRPAVSVVVGGPGWLPELLPPGTSYADSLAHARDLVLTAGDAGTGDALPEARTGQARLS